MCALMLDGGGCKDDHQVLGGYAAAFSERLCSAGASVKGAEWSSGELLDVAERCSRGPRLPS